jgi:hypothetical protein
MIGLFGICIIVSLTTIQSFILMRVVYRLTALESALSATWKRTLIDNDPADSISAIGGLTGEPSNNNLRPRSLDGIGM